MRAAGLVGEAMASAKAAAPDPVPGTLHGLTSIPQFGAWAPPTITEASEEQNGADRVRVQTSQYIFNGSQDMQDTASMWREDHLHSFSAPL